MARRNVERFAMFFGIFNLVLGVLSLFSPMVKQQGPMGFFSRLMPRRSRKIINTGTGQLFGFMGAVNPPHAYLHTAMGALGLATMARPLNRFSRAYLWLLGGLYAAFAVVGWMTVGVSSKTRKVLGFAMDMRGNIVDSILAATLLTLAAVPEMSMNQAMNRVQSTVDQVQNKVQDVVSRGQSKVDSSKVRDMVNKGQNEVDKAQRAAEREVDQSMNQGM